MRDKEMYLQIREAEVQNLKIICVTDERREAMTLQADGLQQKLLAMSDREENLRRRTGGRRQRGHRRNGAAGGREGDLFSLASTIGNSSGHTNVGHSSKSITKLEDPGSWLRRSGNSSRHANVDHSSKSITKLKDRGNYRNEG